MSGTNCVKSILEWNEQDVFDFFLAHGFPTNGLHNTCINGPSLLMLYGYADAMQLFTSPAPDGLGFDHDMYIVVFRKIMRVVTKGIDNNVCHFSTVCGVKRGLENGFDQGLDEFKAARISHN